MDPINVNLKAPRVDGVPISSAVGRRAVGEGVLSSRISDDGGD